MNARYHSSFSSLGRELRAGLLLGIALCQTSLAAQGGLAYGYGLGNYQYVHEGFLFHGHGGDADGYLAEQQKWRREHAEIIGLIGWTVWVGTAPG